MCILEVFPGVCKLLFLVTLLFPLCDLPRTFLAPCGSSFKFSQKAGASFSRFSHVLPTIVIIPWAFMQQEKQGGKKQHVLAPLSPGLISSDSSGSLHFLTVCLLAIMVAVASTATTNCTELLKDWGGEKEEKNPAKTTKGGGRVIPLWPWEHPFPIL